MISLTAVGKTFRKARVLDVETLEIAAGGRVALVGSNGAGKTTLIRCLLGEYLHDGDIRVFGLSPRHDRTALLRRVGFVPQLPPPLRMPVGELVRFATGVGQGSLARIAEVAAGLGLDIGEVASKPFVKLSGGQKQKLLIAVALGRPVDLLVMDEPAANLDPPARAALFRLLGESAATMLVTSHRLDEVAPLVNRVVELDGGRVILDDRVEDAVGMSATLTARVRVSRAEPAFAQAMAHWGFDGGADGLAWTGLVPGPDRLRFLGTMSRYAGLVAGLTLEEESRG
ncbi:MAG: ABC transporter ATP-binding protein [Alphaproteobacteria bacterium]|nr:ABC transporter ATP-binding protein [Alphaproteobacteria bacterium]